MKLSIRTNSKNELGSSAISVASFAALFCCASALMGQSITVRVLNARSGRPLARQSITISWPDTVHKTVVNLGPDGTGKLDLAGRSEFGMLPGPRSDKEPNSISYIDCNDFAKVRAEDVLSRGLVTANRCSNRISATVKPGEVVFWGVPLRWWESDPVRDR